MRARLLCGPVLALVTAAAVTVPAGSGQAAVPTGVLVITSTGVVTPVVTGVQGQLVQTINLTDETVSFAPVAVTTQGFSVPPGIGTIAPPNLGAYQAAGVRGFTQSYVAIASA